jgi:hypothetical protein
MRMYSIITRPLARTTVVAAATVICPVVTLGTATAMDHNTAMNSHIGQIGADRGDPIVIDDPGDRRVHDDTATTVRNSGSGGTAVTVAGSGGNATQTVDQTKTDNSTRSDYRDNSTTINHSASNSHNRSTYRDSHDHTSTDHR